MSLPSDCLLLENTPEDLAVAQLNVTRLGEWEAEQIRGRLFELAARRRGQDLHLDLARLEYLSSGGLALLLGLHRQVKASGGRLSLLNVGDPVHEVFALSRLTTLLDIRRQGAEDGPPAASA